MVARSRIVAVAAVVAALCAATTVVVINTRGASDASTPAVLAPNPPPNLDRFYAQTLAWEPCPGYATTAEDRVAFAAPAFDCARLEVPLDYAAPDARTAQVGVLRQRATGDRIGSLLLNPGGPGASGMELVTALSGRLRDNPVSSRFDLVGFDPRGVGSSTPAIDCLDDEDWQLERADLDVDPSPAGVAESEAENRLWAQRCAERSGGMEVLAHVGTREVV